MATKLAIGTGNLTAAGTWVSGDTGTNAVLLSTSSGTTALTTGNLDSATFTLSANAMQWILLRLGSRAAGSPSNTMTITLVNSTAAGLRVPSAWVVNVSDLPVCTTAGDDGGYILLKANATWTPNGTDVYLVRATLSATTTAVSLCTNGTANNWQRAVGRAATSAPVAGDDMHIAAIFSNSTSPATRSTVVVTQDQTAATDYGSANTSYRIPALAVSSGGTLTWARVAATNYIMQLSGCQALFLGGVVNHGGVGTECPRDSTQTLQFDCAADGDFGVRNQGTYNITGLSRISGSSNTYVVLSGDAAALATTINTTTQLSGKSGDTVIVTTTGAGVDSKTLNADAGATSFVTTVGVANAHKGTTPLIAEAFVLERGPTIKAVTAGLMSFFLNGTVGVFVGSWMRLSNCGTNSSGTYGFDLQHTTGSFTISNSIIDGADGIALRTNGSTGTTSITNCCFYNNQATTNAVQVHMDQASGTVTFQNCVITQCKSANSWLMTITNPSASGTYDTILCSGQCNIGLNTAATEGNSRTFANFTVRSTAAAGWQFAATQNLTVSNLTMVSTINGVTGGGFSNVLFTGGVIAASGTGNRACFSLTTTVNHYNLTINNMRLAGLAVSGTDYAFRTSSVTQFTNCVFLNLTFGGSGTYADLAVGTFNMPAADQYVEFTGSGLSGLTAANISIAAPWFGSFVCFQVSPTLALSYGRYGTVFYETTTVDVSPSVKMTPNNASFKLESGLGIAGFGFLAPVDSSGVITTSIKVNVDGSYNGAAPRLIVKANPAIGINADTVIATHPGGTGSFSTLSGPAPAVTGKGVLEFVVDCDGTAGNIYVDTFTVSGTGADALSGLTYWFAGLPC